jgi:hypothetical protein
LRKDADAFRRKMRDVLLHLDAKRAREISSRADYLKAAETGEDDRLETLHEEVEGLTQETAELFSEMLDVLQRHHTFLGQVADAMEEHEISAGADGQMQVGGVAGGRSAGVDHHQLRRSLALAPALEQPLEQNRMAFSRVGADQQDKIGLVEIVVTAGRSIGTQAAAIASHG